MNFDNVKVTITKTTFSNITLVEDGSLIKIENSEEFAFSLLSFSNIKDNSISERRILNSENFYSAIILEDSAG